MFKIFILIAIPLISGCQKSLEASWEAEIVEYGVYRTEGEGKVLRQPSTAAGKSSIGDSVLLYTGSDVKLQERQGVGFTYEIHCSEKCSGKTIEIVIRHPLIRSGEGNELTASRYLRNLPETSGRYRSSLVYFFNEHNEMVPGLWSLSLEYDGKPLLKREFTVHFENRT